MNSMRLVMVLGDQLSHENPALVAANPESDTVVLAEVAEETSYVPHNRHKLVLVLSAMRHFAAELRGQGFKVIYFPLSDGLPSLFAAAERAVETTGAAELLLCEAGEYRLKQEMDHWQDRLGVEVSILEDTRFLIRHGEFADWAGQQKQLRMEYFYRMMRKRYGLLIEGGAPAGGRWNYDRENRRGWRGSVAIPERKRPGPDPTTREVIAEVNERFPDNPGELERFGYAVTRDEAQQQLDWFCQHALTGFGTWQDAMTEESPWLFHSVVSMYINIGLLEPLAVCQQVEEAWRTGGCDLSAAEGFIRQVLGWREYMRGIYWLHMPGYAEHNVFNARRPLPDWFWTGETDLKCLQHALQQSLDLGYAHHIQRLMIIGNFALLAGLSVPAVCEWFLAVYVDAFEWVELPNTLGMALAADGGLLASKPYAASGKYIQRQGNYCQGCAFDPRKMTGPGACPFNALYWRFLHVNSEQFAGNPRMSLMLANWARKPPEEQAEILRWADGTLAELAPGEAP
jgi:deoxyribodipyrimidine photolyase-related protein